MPPVVQSLLLTLNVTAMLSEKYEEVQAYLVADSHLVQNLFELEEMKKTLSGDSVSYICTVSIIECSNTLE